MRKRITRYWELWLESFGGGIASILEKYLRRQESEWVADRLEAIFKEIGSIVTLVYEGLDQGVEDLGSTSLQLALDRVHNRKMLIKRMGTAAAKKLNIIQYIEQGDFLPHDVKIRETIYDASNRHSFPPFNAKELSQINGQRFDPPLSNYRNLEERKWGGRTFNVSQPGEYAFCRDVVNGMSMIADNDYDRNWWSQIAFVSDGTCGSACALFLQGIQSSGDAVGFTYGGIANQPLDVASFAGGNVEEYTQFTAELALARRIARLASQDLDEWSKAHVNSFVDSPVPMSTKSTARFNWNMMFVKVMTDDPNSKPLPRQFYLIPARKHLSHWPSNQRDMDHIYAEIAAIQDWAQIPAQFSQTHGQCPDEATPFAKRKQAPPPPRTQV